MRRPGDLGLLLKLVRHSPRNGRRIAVLLAVSLLASPLALLGPLPLKIAVDTVLGGKPLPGPIAQVLPSGVLSSPGAILLGVAVLALAVTLLAKLQNLAQVYLTVAAGEKMVLDVRADMFRRLQHISLAYHDTQGTADSLYRVQTDATAVRNIVIDGMVPFVASAATFIGMAVVTARIDLAVAAAALAVAPALLVFVRVYRPRLRRRSRLAKKTESQALGVVQEVLGALRVVKAFRREEGEQTRFLERSAESMRQRLRASLTEGGFAIVVGLLMAVGTAGVLFVGVGHVRAGLLSLGNFLLIIGYVAKLYDPLTTTARKVGSLQTHLASLERAFAVLELEPEVIEKTDARPLVRARGEFDVQDVTFRYGDGGRPALSGVSFRVPAGERVGLVGATGAGKSTLVSLLMRFYDPTAGRILLDGVDIRQYRVDDLRRQFAYMPQDPVLFTLSIGENIAYGAPGATEAQIRQAAVLANAARFIDALPEGFATRVGERGVTLSGGERQRIALARAFLLDAPILLLDEPTSALDFTTESEVAEALARLQEGRTVFTISHRPTALAGCSLILKLEHGTLAAGPTGAGRSAAPFYVAVEGGVPRRPRLLSHPAVEAWMRVRQSAHPPLRIAPGAGKKRGKVRVFRLEGALPGRTVFAKWIGPEDGSIERTLYERVFTRISAGVPEFFGCTEDPRDGGTWLFTGEAGGAEYDSSLQDHRARSARWLAATHAQARSLDRETVGMLPVAGAGRSLAHLKTARRTILESLDNPVFDSLSVSFLKDLVETLDLVEQRWGILQEEERRLPPTLVHGDFNGKNTRVPDGGQPLVVFDWESAGWGSPVIDLAQLLTTRSNRICANPDLDVYTDHAAPRLSRNEVERCAMCGTIFRLLAALEWSAGKLAHEWADALIEPYQLFETDLRDALGRLGIHQGRLAATAVSGTTTQETTTGGSHG